MMKNRLSIGGLLFFIIFSTSAFAEDTLKNYEISITKGVYSIEKGEYDTAIAELEKALLFKPGDRDALLSLGVAQGRKGDYKKAKEVLTQALEKHRGDERIKYELGVVLYRLGESESAVRYFSEVEQEGVNDDIRSASTSYIEILSSNHEPEERTFVITFLGGWQYDSNVILESDNPASTDGRKSDWRALLSVDARLTFLRSSLFLGKAEYMFYESLHHELGHFNINQHNLRLSGLFNTSSWSQFQVKYHLSYSRAGDDLYSSVNSISPSFLVNFSPRTITELSYTHTFNTYFDSDHFPLNSERSGDKNTITVSQMLGFGKNTGLTIAYAYDMDRTDADFWDYNGHKGLLRLSARFGDTRSYISASYHNRKYSNAIPGFTEERQDGLQEYALHIIFPLSKSTSLTLSEAYVINSSNLVFYDYKRSITGIMLVVGL